MRVLDGCCFACPALAATHLTSPLFARPNVFCCYAGFEVGETVDRPVRQQQWFRGWSLGKKRQSGMPSTCAQQRLHGHAACTIPGLQHGLHYSLHGLPWPGPSAQLGPVGPSGPVVLPRRDEQTRDTVSGLTNRCRCSLLHKLRGGDPTVSDSLLVQFDGRSMATGQHLSQNLLDDCLRPLPRCCQQVLLLLLCTPHHYT